MTYCRLALKRMNTNMIVYNERVIWKVITSERAVSLILFIIHCRRMAESVKIRINGQPQRWSHNWTQPVAKETCLSLVLKCRRVRRNGHLELKGPRFRQVHNSNISWTVVAHVGRTRINWTPNSSAAGKCKFRNKPIILRIILRQAVGQTFKTVWLVL